MARSLHLVTLRTVAVTVTVTVAAAALGACGSVDDGESTASVSFSHLEQPFGGQSFDTGWQPEGSPVQVRFYVTAQSQVGARLPGRARLDRGPQGASALGLSYEAEPGSGSFWMDLGVQISGRLKINRPPVVWEGAIPYAPNFDYRFADKESFTPFLLEGEPAPVSTLDDKAGMQVLCSADIIGIPYVGTAKVVLKAGGHLHGELSGRSITTTLAGATVRHTRQTQVEVVPDAGGSLLEGEARHEAHATFEGGLVLAPGVTVGTSLLDKWWTLAEFPIDIDLVQLGRVDFSWTSAPSPLALTVP